MLWHELLGCHRQRSSNKLLCCISNLHSWRLEVIFGTKPPLGSVIVRKDRPMNWKSGVPRQSTFSLWIEATIWRQKCNIALFRAHESCGSEAGLRPGHRIGQQARVYSWEWLIDRLQAGKRSRDQASDLVLYQSKRALIFMTLSGWKGGDVQNKYHRLGNRPERHWAFDQWALTWADLREVFDYGKRTASDRWIKQTGLNPSVDVWLKALKLAKTVIRFENPYFHIYIYIVINLLNHAINIHKSIERSRDYKTINLTNVLNKCYWKR